ncbi:MAG: dTDP-glucose 4,6-dehydratase, partial [Phycisphaerae bacterium]|nr:dTDP-glucose 4,6-dehydratase [Phycisphaerae bacterium]
MTILVTGGSGFIGSNFVLNWIDTTAEVVINLDAMTYAGNPENLQSIHDSPQYEFVRGNIDDLELVSAILDDRKPRAIVNFAAESHVDRSIHGPAEFIQTNIVGTFNLLESTKSYWSQLPEADKHKFRFLHVSTDEV